MNVRSPFEEIRMVGPKGDIDVPPRVTRILVRRKPYRECADRPRFAPSPATDKLVEGVVQPFAVTSGQKGRLCVMPEPHNRSGPGLGIIWIAAGVAPEYGERLLGDLA